MTGDVSVEKKSCLDVISHQDLPQDTVSAIGYGNGCGNGANATAAKDDSDNSYVFVSGNDDDHDDNGVDIAVPNIVEPDENNDGGVDVAAAVNVNAESQLLDRETGESNVVKIKVDSGVGDTLDSPVQVNDTSQYNDDGVDVAASVNVTAESQPLDGEIGESDVVKIKADPGVGDTADSPVQINDTPHSNNVVILEDVKSEAELANGHLYSDKGEDVLDDHNNKCGLLADTSGQCELSDVGQGADVEESESIPRDTADETAGKSEVEPENSVVNQLPDKETIDLIEKSESTPLATANKTAIISENEAEISVGNPPPDEETIDLVEKSESTPLATAKEATVISENEAQNSVVNPIPNEETIALVEKFESPLLATANETAVVSGIDTGSYVVNPLSDKETSTLAGNSDSTPLSTADETTVKSEIEAKDSVINAPSYKETIDLVEKSESPPLSAANGTAVKSKLEAEDSVVNPLIHKETIDDSRTEGEVEVLDNGSSDIVDSLPFDHAEFGSEEEKGLVANDKFSSNRELPENEASSAFISSQEKGVETKVSVGSDEDGESTENNCSASGCSVEKVEPPPNNDVSVAAKCDIVNDSVVADKSNLNRASDDVHVQVVSVNESEQTSREVGSSTSPPEGSTADASDWQNEGSEPGRRPIHYIIRIPRYDDHNLKEQIKDAQLQVDANTKSRDVVQTEVRTKRAICKKLSDDFEAAKMVEKSARDLLQVKRKEIDSLQSLINCKDIDSRIRNLEHMIQHETLALKEEKQFIREIKQLKQQREQFSSDMGIQNEEQDNKKDQVEERLKILRKEAESLRVNLMKAETATKAARMKYFDEKQRLKELQDQFDVAAGARQKAYVHLQSLRAKLKEKNKCFWKYKDDATAAYDLAKKGDKEELQRLCINQVEEVMKLWNSSDEFRKEYVRCNVRSTLRRLRTLDGRSLGPDEEPPVIPTLVIDRVAKGNAAPSVTSIEKEKEVAFVEAGKIDYNPVLKVEDKKNQNVKTKKPIKYSVPEKDLAVAETNEMEKESQEEHKPTKEELELAQKAETLRKEEEEAALKEQQRLEEKAKAMEAMERKKRVAEKAQARAAVRAQKEAEQKEKEKEKRLRKKEKKKAAVEDANEGEASPTSAPPLREPEMEEKLVTVTKQAQKHPRFTKQTKAKSVPPPFRNRGKRKMQTWMWVLLIVLLLGVALFYYW